MAARRSGFGLGGLRFLGLGLLAMAVVASCKSMGMGPEAAPPAPAALGPAMLYAGVGKSLRVFSIDRRTGALSSAQAIEGLSNTVHYVAFHPNRKVLYATVGEVPPPTDRAAVSAIHSFAIDSDSGTLSALGAPVPLPLGRAIHLSVDNSGGYLMTAHNFAESVAVFKLHPDGKIAGPVAQPVERQGLGFLVHQIRIDPSNRWVFVPVRGEDAKDDNGTAVPEKMGHLAVFSFSDGTLTRDHVMDFPTLLGPRHLDFHPTKPLVYVGVERGNLLKAYKREGGKLSEIATRTTLADTSLKFPAQRVGAVRVHPNGKVVYVTNRNDKPPQPGENSIAVFSLDSPAAPRLIQHVPSQGYEPRTLTIDPSGKFLIVANQKNLAPREGEAKVMPNLTVFRISADDGKLKHLETYQQGGGDAWWVGALALPGKKEEAVAAPAASTPSGW